MNRACGHVNCGPSRVDIILINRYRMDLAFVQTAYSVLNAAKPAKVEEALRDADPRVRYAAVMVAGDRRLELTKSYQNLLDDKDDLVKAGAKRALDRLEASPGTKE